MVVANDRKSKLDPSLPRIGLNIVGANIARNEAPVAVAYYLALSEGFVGHD